MRDIDDVHDSLIRFLRGTNPTWIEFTNNTGEEPRETKIRRAKKCQKSCIKPCIKTCNLQPSSSAI